jgi:hypothetical protein
MEDARNEGFILEDAFSFGQRRFFVGDLWRDEKGFRNYYRKRLMPDFIIDHALFQNSKGLATTIL